MNLNLPFLKSDDALPGGVTRPTWVVLDLSGPYPERQPTNPVAGLLSRTESLEALAARIEKLRGASWLHGVLVRFGEFTAAPATAHAIRGLLADLQREKRVVAYLPQLNMLSLIAASGAGELVSPESAEVNVSGFGLESTFLGEFLKKRGIEFENLRIREYKAALTRFSEERMDDHNREQLQAYLSGLEGAWVRDLAAARGVSEDVAAGWLAEDLTSAQAALEAGLITKVAYEDELIGPASRPFAAVADLLLPARPGKAAKAGRVAVVPLVGAIITGKSRTNPIPLPLLGGPMAGSDTVVAALRRAKQDKTTKAIVLYVNSGGGSALASDLIWREVATSEKPVVVVMGEYAASGGYYVATHAKTIVASPYTLTGSIGVVSGKPVLTEFNRRHGLNPERVGRDRALMFSPARPYTDDEREHVEKGILEVYDRFTNRVAEGRNLSKERVNELGRGRIWSGQDALDRGLVDELGDLRTGLARARELAGLPADAPAWNVTPKNHGPLPEFAQEAAQAARVTVWPFGGERVLTWFDQEIKVR
ncbi:signal peptide peptidase SppA [Deinococcus soli (ex Cha et al. 2016)]|uniref:Protease-4 n=2 Tax=Deinococcus soli (ex Cha et al. 2016) TaxID=1309411 RepID=A0ACC6KIY9_9DEIO|nr:signal peptide peptidase SppA [Deinococcus soli (ex Cha et al. 2016)]MDR6219429.1 protease-4 [Deinococcus soli (ex Cha et al. 2016)]MDR6327108.1 protease-4 [Deinococcus soli (ex Cha et al. 2016)]MDR6752426.1 protease-4 [Deinococcus soli (ex Cha et al. 2016)]